MILNHLDITLGGYRDLYFQDMTFSPHIIRVHSNNSDLSNSLKPGKIQSSNTFKYNRIYSPKTFEKQRILVVDDDADISNLFKLSLEREGFVVDTFNHSQLALSSYKAGAYDLLLLDIKMPDLNGFELFQKIRRLDDKAKVCFITAFEESENEFKRLFPDLGEDCLIRKPIKLQALTQQVRSHLAV